ncbi:MAG: hypothetical protein RSC33_03325 [Vagococcus sp.]
MGTYYVEEHLLSAKVRVFIKNEKGEPVFLLVGSWGVKGDCVSVYDLDGHRLSKAVQNSFGPRPDFDLFEGGQKVGTLKRCVSLLNDYYYISGLGWIASGNHNKKSYRFFHFGTQLLETGIIQKEGKQLMKVILEDETRVPLSFCVLAVLDYWVKKGKRAEELYDTSIVPFEDLQKSFFKENKNSLD